MRNKKIRRPYYVVRFIEVPFEGINKYVCVPLSWITIERYTDKKVCVAYPHDEDPVDTRDRAKRNETYSDEWKFYMAESTYETETYRDAEYWIASRNDYMPWVEKDPRRKAAQPESTSDGKLPSGSRNHPSKSTRDRPQLKLKVIENFVKLPAKMSLKRAAQSEAAEQFDEKRRRQNNAAQASRSAGYYINMKPGCSRREQSTVIGERHQTEAAAASSSDNPIPSQLPSLPIIDVDEEVHLHDERQPRLANSNSQSQRASNTTIASMAPPQPPTSVEQPPHSDRHNHRRHSQDRENSNSNFQPRITEIRSIRETEHEQIPLTNEIPNNEPYASHHLPSSQKMSARLYSLKNDRPSLIPMHEPLEMRIRLANSERLMAIAAQNPSNLMDKRRPSPPERQERTVTQNSLQDSPHFRIKIGKSYDMNAIDPKIVLESIADVASGSQHTASLPHERPSFVRRIRKRRNSPPLEQCQQQPMDVPDALQRPSGSHSIAQRTSLEEVLMHKASTVQRLPNPAANQPNTGAPQSYQNNPSKYLLHLERLDARLQGKPIDHNPGSKVPSQNITPAATGEGPPFSSQQDRRELLRSDSDNMCRPSLPQQRLIYQLPEAAMNRVPSEGNIVNPSAVRSPPRSAAHVHQTNKRMEVDPVYPGESSSSDPGVAVDHEVIPEQETFTHNADSAGTSGGQSSASANNQPHTRMALERQIVGHFPTILTQMGSTLYYACEMYKNIRSSLLETADTYKKLMEAAERFNALVDAESAASFSRNVAPRTLLLNEERQTRAAKRANSSNHHQHSSRADKEPPNKKSFFQ